MADGLQEIPDDSSVVMPMLSCCDVGVRLLSARTGLAR
jgi:hypothetical protein